jgi:hypothetical protein
MSAATLSESTAGHVLGQSAIPALRRLHVEVTNSDIILSGIVASYYMKQLAQETIMPHIGDRKLRNRIIVATK